MVKKSTRLLSFILAALMLVTMLPVLSFAEEVKSFNGEALTTTKEYYEGLDFTALVGPGNEEIENIFILDSDWKFKPGNEPETVSFVFRGEKVTEKFSSARHFNSVALVTKYITENGIKNPIFILTEGEYSERFRFSQGYTILGPKAGMNPNVPNADPTKEWAMSADRKIPTETEYFGEAVFRVEGGFGGDHFIVGGNDNVGTQNFIVDGVVFQGDGSGVADESSSGGGTRNWYVQNCIFDDCYSTGGRGNWSGLAFDQRASQTTVKNLYLSNSYITNQNTVPLYSGHATGIYFNGVSVQNCNKGPFYNIGCIQWQGQTTSLTNCHFWNPKDFVRTNGAVEGIYINFNVSNYCNSGFGTDDAPFRLNVKNNSFYHVNTSSAPLIQCSMAGNTKVAVEENIFISEENKDARPAIEFLYLTANGVVTHNGIGNYSSYQVDGVESKVGDYKMTNEQALIQNNTFVGSEFQVLPEIFTNLNKETKVELLGNLYLDTLSSTEGKMIDPYVEDAQIYNKWVWLDANRTKKSSEIFESDIEISTGGQPIAFTGYQATLDLGSKEYTKTIEVQCNAAKNSIRVYQADASWVKGARVSGDGLYTLNTADRTSYYIVSIVSIDGRTEKDYKITLHRAPNMDAQLNAVLPQGNPEIISSSVKDGVHTYNVGFSVKNFKFKLDASNNTKIFVQDSNGILKPDANGVYTTEDLAVGKQKEYIIHVIDNNGEGYREYFYLNINRAANTAANIEKITSKQATSVTSGGTTFTVNVPYTTKKMDLSFKLSEGAKMEMTDPIYKMPVVAKNGVYTIDPVLAGTNTYSVKVTSQDGEFTKNWKVKIVRTARKDCKLLGIADTEKIGNMYVAYTANNKFMVSASVSEGATYRLYSDAACTKALASATVTLKKETTNVWLKVIAENEEYTSEPVKIVINTFGDVYTGSTTVNPKMADNGIIGVTGGQFSASDNTVVVTLAPYAKKYAFRIQGYDNYVARVYSDNTKNPMRVANDTMITLDSGRTVLYATATKGSGANKKVVEYTIIILSPKTYKYTDKQTNWASGYIKEVAENGWGLMKGDDKGKFNGTNPLTRYEMSALMVRLSGANANFYASCTNPFTDTIAAWALNYVKAASRMGLINGYEVKNAKGEIRLEFQGSKKATRSEFFRVFTNVLLGTDVESYYAKNQSAIDSAVNALGLADLDTIAAWAKPAVYTAIYKGLVQGNDKKMINPKANITRNEVAAVLSRYLAKA